MNADVALLVRQLVEQIAEVMELVRQDQVGVVVVVLIAQVVVHGAVLKRLLDLVLPMLDIIKKKNLIRMQDGQLVVILEHEVQKENLQFLMKKNLFLIKKIQQTCLQQ